MLTISMLSKPSGQVELHVRVQSARPRVQLPMTRGHEESPILKITCRTPSCCSVLQKLSTAHCWHVVSLTASSQKPAWQEARSRISNPMYAAPRAGRCKFATFALSSLGGCRNRSCRPEAVQRGSAKSLTYCEMRARLSPYNTVALKCGPCNTVALKCELSGSVCETPGRKSRDNTTETEHVRDREHPNDSKCL